MILARTAELFRALDTYHHQRTSPYRDHIANDVADALDALGGHVLRTAQLSNAIGDLLALRREVHRAASDAPDTHVHALAGARRYLAMRIADAVCDMTYPLPASDSARTLAAPPVAGATSDDDEESTTADDFARLADTPAPSDQPAAHDGF